MTKLYCPNCGPIRRTIMRSCAGLDLDCLPPGPVPGSRCGACGSQLWVGTPSIAHSIGSTGEKWRPLVVGAITGCALWSFTGGFIHAYVISPNWGMMSQSIGSLVSWRSLLALICTGFLFGVSIEIAKFFGGSLRSNKLVLLLPIVGGVAIGVVQGLAVVTNFWGFPENLTFRDSDTRLWTGAMTGLILTYPSIIMGIVIRRKGMPW